MERLWVDREVSVWERAVIDIDSLDQTQRETLENAVKEGLNDEINNIVVNMCGTNFEPIEDTYEVDDFELWQTRRVGREFLVCETRPGANGCDG